MADTDISNSAGTSQMAGPSSVPSTSSSGSAGSGLVINRRRQEGNPLLKYVRNVRYEWGDIGPDFECGSNCGVLYLALKYHRLHPDYIHTRISGKRENNYLCKVLLVLCNVEEPKHLLREINLLCYRREWTLIICYSVEEAAEYIENLKLSDGRDPSFRKPHSNEPMDERTELMNAAIAILTSARSITKTDAQRLLINFGSLKNIAMAKEEQLAMCPGLGPIRAANLYKYLRQNFSNA